MNLKELLLRAEQEKKAIGHFNVSNLEQLKAIAEVAQKMNVPVIIGVSEGERDFMGIHQVRSLIDSYNKEYSERELARRGEAWLFLNADHTHSLENVRKAAEARFDAILFDPTSNFVGRGASSGKLSLEENIQQTKEAVRIIKSINRDILIEAELGYIGSASELREDIPQGAVVDEKDLTSPEDAVRFVRETGVDMLAPAVGNLHGMEARIGADGTQIYADAPLNIQRIRDIKEALRQTQSKPIPLVLHGASGNTHDDIRAAIEAGISLVHISTELRLAWRKGTEEALKEHPDEVAPYKLERDAIEAMKRLVEEKLKVFGW